MKEITQRGLSVVVSMEGRKSRPSHVSAIHMYIYVCVKPLYARPPHLRHDFRGGFTGCLAGRLRAGGILASSFAASYTSR